MAKSKNKFDALHIVLFVFAFAALGVGMLGTSFAARGGKADVTGSLSLTSPTGDIYYGDDVTFATTVSGKLANNSRVYVTLVCLGDNVSYQWSKWDEDLTFPLVDQAGQGLEWNGEPAVCEAWLQYRVQKGKNVSLSTLDSMVFEVLGQL